LAEFNQRRDSSLDDRVPDPGRVFTCSDFAYGLCLRHPDWPDLLGARLYTQESAQSLYRHVMAALDTMPGTDEQQLRLIRQVRNRELLRIIWLEVVGLSTVEQTLESLSGLADALLETATRWAGQRIAERFGQVRGADGEVAALQVVAMGKLGGRELNFSSDVDLLFFHCGSGDSDGARSLPAENYFIRVAQQLIHLLQTPTGDGFVYRVDMRLRPFGDSGALVVSLDALETYLQQHGREWERYAYIKARVLGESKAARLFSEVVRPFVYRRYLDFGVLESLREMKALIAADVVRAGREDDIKLGPGGIREIEFIVQAFQLLRGGSDPVLRDPRLLTVLPALAERRWIEPVQATQIGTAYRLLRRVENHLQLWRDEQVHVLPDQAADRERLAYGLGYPAWEALRAEVSKQRGRVQRYFRDTMGGPAEDTADTLETLWKAQPGALATSAEFASLGFANAGELAGRLRGLRRSRQYAQLDRRGRQRLDILVPCILRAASQFDNADAVAHRLLLVIEAVGRRSAYFALLNENRPVLQRLAMLVAASSWIAHRVAENPILLDELIDPQLFEIPPRRVDFEADLVQRFAAIDDDDLEGQMEALRRFRQASVFRVAVADLSGVLPLMKVSDRLTDIAELVLGRAIDCATAELRRRHGQPRNHDGVAGFGIVAYGKLGGLELGYASDLDLVFIHNAENENGRTDGNTNIDNSRYFARLGQRIVHMLSTTTVAGVLYEVDMRLRPSGKAGPMVSSLAAFERYQLHSAWTWEHQALLRTRAVAGSETVCREFERIRLEVLTRPRDPALLRAEVQTMRERMRNELPHGDATVFDIKNDPGGLTDIEFIVQYLVLAHAQHNPELVRYSDNIRQLESLAAAAIVAETEAARLADIYRRYRQRLHRLALADAPARIPAGEFATARDTVRQIWRQRFGA
ncbi:MAG: bifunctional [glutamate--ammonia ligase]-adenylyl-L-tyrosine phosphorylase/[glutamate--ammonia-ligase] adenylyltransferase, partial [Gammaproteobacteria bacterium]|nr:bifunctional [glutamate--ammonia ligase]-adenylyl-L-tyrosine phosphorylase/[glutamate--ammonia-ligase] adenylyltransferase [Gammaproteobacteria bacterium]